MSRDLTIGEVISDPMIVQLLQADNVPVAAFVQLLQSAARIQRAQVERAGLEIPTGDAAALGHGADTMSAA